MASENLGASFSIDVTDLKTGLAQANRLIRESESQFKAAAAGMDDWSKSEEGISARIKSLNEITDIQRKKVDALKNEYQSLIKNGLDPASKEAVELRTKINQEEAALAKNEKELKDQEAALKNVGKGADDAGDKFEKFGEIAKAAGKVAAAAFAAAGAAVGALLKQSIEGYAEYEQLVGGVDTLFKGASQKLQGYAADAYKTAGMSANEYMANVTSFSAALISSLGGDTDKAADVADRAMRDMSDNANKMGTDMQSIVDTYQSLSRGNFQMLDNLKLGYGGTKTEMERLIADAAKLTDVQKELGISVDATDMSFANMVNAISVIQTEMGITGTTAKEAGSTIQGSVSAMKAAWQNLATGMADENANIDQLITNFIDSVGTAAENILPRITIAIDGILRVAEKLLPQIPPLIEQFLPVLLEGIMGLLDGVVSVFPTIADTILSLIPDVLTQLLSKLPEILSTILILVGQILSTLGDLIPVLVDKIMEILPELISALVSATPQLIQGAIQFLMAIVRAIPTIIDNLLQNLPFIIDTIISGLISAMPQLVDGAILLFNAILQAIPVICDSLIRNMPQIISSIVNGLINGMGAIVEAGGQLIEGLWEGIKGAGAWLWDKISGFFGGIVDGIKGFFGIHSPSTLMENLVGKNLALGIGVGFEENMADVNKKINKAIKLDDVGINASVSSGMAGDGGGKTVVVYQTNNYSQAHSRYEIYKSKQQTLSAVQLALAGV